MKVSQQLKKEQQQRLTGPHSLREGREGGGTGGRNEGTREGEGKEQKKEGDKHDAAKKSDALLSCPACITTVCIDCQQ